MIDARDRVIVALCDTIETLRKRIADLEMMAAVKDEYINWLEAKPGTGQPTDDQL